MNILPPFVVYDEHSSIDADVSKLLEAGEGCLRQAIALLQRCPVDRTYDINRIYTSLDHLSRIDL